MRGRHGELKAVTAATVAAASVLDAWRPGGRVDKTYTPQRPDWGHGIEGLTDDESDEFMASITG